MCIKMLLVTEMGIYSKDCVNENLNASSIILLNPVDDYVDFFCNRYFLFIFLTIEGAAVALTYFVRKP